LVLVLVLLVLGLRIGRGMHLITILLRLLRGLSSMSIGGGRGASVAGDIGTRGIGSGVARDVPGLVGSGIIRHRQRRRRRRRGRLLVLILVLLVLMLVLV
jgi:hypothetical protein